MIWIVYIILELFVIRTMKILRYAPILGMNLIVKIQRRARGFDKLN